MTVTMDPAALLKQLEDSSNQDHTQIYQELNRILKDEKRPSVIQEVCVHTSSWIDVVLEDVKNATDVQQKEGLMLLGFLLSNTKSEQSLDDTTWQKVLEALLSLIVAKKEISSKALQCLSKVSIPENILIAKVDKFLNSVEVSLSSDVSGMHYEACCLLQRLLFNYPKVMGPVIGKWVRPVFSPLVNPSSDVREVALTTMENCLPLLLDHQNAIVPGLISLLKMSLLKDMMDLFNNKQEHFVLKVWGLIVTILGKALHKGTSLINSMLEIVVKGFKSRNVEVHIAAFTAWQYLIDNFAKDIEILSNPKRLKLLLQPVKMSVDKSEAAVLKRSAVWWHLVWSLNDKLSSNFEQACVPLLQFALASDLKDPGVSIPSPRTGSPLELNHFGPKIDTLQKKGCELLARLLEQPSLSSPAFSISPKKVPNFSTPSLKTPLPSSIFTHYARELIQAVHVVITSLGKCGKSVNLIQYVLHLLVSNIALVQEDGSKDSIEAVTKFLQLVHDIVKGELCSPSVTLKLLDDGSMLPKRMLTSHYYDINHEGIMHGIPAFTLLSLLFDSSLLPLATTLNNSFLHTFTHLVISGIQGSPSFLSFTNAVMQILAQQRISSSLPSEILVNMWVAVVLQLIEAIERTQEVNQGDSLEHDFSCLLSALSFPLLHLTGLPQRLAKQALKLWTDLYRLFARCSSLVVTAEANSSCEGVCQMIETTVSPEHWKNEDFLGALCSLLQVVVECVDFTSLGKSNEVSSSPIRWAKKKYQPMENLTSLVTLLAKLISAVHLSKEEEEEIKRKKPEAYKNKQALNSAAILLVEMANTLFTSITVPRFIPPLVLLLASPLSNFYSTNKKYSVKAFGTQFTSKLELLWTSITNALQIHYTGPYDNDLLVALCPLLEVTLLNTRQSIQEKTRQFWYSTFGHNLAILTFPSSLKTVLKKMKPSLVPEFRLSSTEEMDVSTFSPDSESAILPPRMSIFNIKDIQEKVTSNVQNSHKENSTPVKQSHEKKTILSVSNVDELPEEEFVKIDSAPSNKKVLTEHQKEALKQKSYVPAMYNDLSQDTQDNSIPSSLDSSCNLTPSVTVIKEKSKSASQAESECKGDTGKQGKENFNTNKCSNSDTSKNDSIEIISPISIKNSEEVKSNTVESEIVLDSSVKNSPDAIHSNSASAEKQCTLEAEIVINCDKNIDNKSSFVDLSTPPGHAENTEMLNSSQDVTSCAADVVKENNVESISTASSKKDVQNCSQKTFVAETQDDHLLIETAMQPTDLSIKKKNSPVKTVKSTIKSPSKSPSKLSHQLQSNKAIHQDDIFAFDESEDIIPSSQSSPESYASLRNKNALQIFRKSFNSEKRDLPKISYVASSPNNKINFTKNTSPKKSPKKNVLKNNDVRLNEVTDNSKPKVENSPRKTNSPSPSKMTPTKSTRLQKSAVESSPKRLKINLQTLFTSAPPSKTSKKNSVQKSEVKPLDENQDATKKVKPCIETASVKINDETCVPSHSKNTASCTSQISSTPTKAISLSPVAEELDVKNNLSIESPVKNQENSKIQYKRSMRLLAKTLLLSQEKDSSNSEGLSQKLINEISALSSEETMQTSKKEMNLQPASVLNDEANKEVNCNNTCQNKEINTPLKNKEIDSIVQNGVSPSKCDAFEKSISQNGSRSFTVTDSDKSIECSRTMTPGLEKCSEQNSDQTCVVKEVLKGKDVQTSSLEGAQSGEINSNVDDQIHSLELNYSFNSSPKSDTPVLSSDTTVEKSSSVASKIACPLQSETAVLEVNSKHQLNGSPELDSDVVFSSTDSFNDSLESSMSSKNDKKGKRKSSIVGNKQHSKLNIRKKSESTSNKKEKKSKPKLSYESEKERDKESSLNKASKKKKLSLELDKKLVQTSSRKKNLSKDNKKPTPVTKKNTKKSKVQNSPRKDSDIKGHQDGKHSSEVSSSDTSSSFETTNSQKQADSQTVDANTVSESDIKSDKLKLNIMKRFTDITFGTKLEAQQKSEILDSVATSLKEKRNSIGIKKGKASQNNSTCVKDVPSDQRVIVHVDNEISFFTNTDLEVHDHDTENRHFLKGKNSKRPKVAHKNGDKTKLKTPSPDDRFQDGRPLVKNSKIKTVPQLNLAVDKSPEVSPTKEKKENILKKLGYSSESDNSGKGKNTKKSKSPDIILNNRKKSLDGSKTTSKFQEKESETVAFTANMHNKVLAKKKQVELIKNGTLDIDLRTEMATDIKFSEVNHLVADEKSPLIGAKKRKAGKSRLALPISSRLRSRTLLLHKGTEDSKKVKNLKVKQGKNVSFKAATVKGKILNLKKKIKQEKLSPDVAESEHFESFSQAWSSMTVLHVEANDSVPRTSSKNSAKGYDEKLGNIKSNLDLACSEKAEHKDVRTPNSTVPEEILKCKDEKENFIVEEPTGKHVTRKQSSTKVCSTSSETKRTSLPLSPLSRSQKMLQAAIRNAASPHLRSASWKREQQTLSMNLSQNSKSHASSILASVHSPPRWTKHVYSPSASPSASILKKRRLSDEQDKESPSPIHKHRKVSFAEPPVQGEILIFSSRRSSIKPVSRCLDMNATKKKVVVATRRSKRKMLDKLADESTSPEKKSKEDSQNNDATPTSSSSPSSSLQPSTETYQSSQNEEDSESALCPELIGCKDPVDALLPRLTSTMWVRGLGHLVHARNIKTVGDLSCLTPPELKSLPIRSPKIKTVIKVLQDYLTKWQKQKSKEAQASNEESADCKQALDQCETMKELEENIENSKKKYNVKSKHDYLDDENQMSIIASLQSDSISLGNKDLWEENNRIVKPDSEVQLQNEKTQNDLEASKGQNKFEIGESQDSLDTVNSLVSLEKADSQDGKETPKNQAGSAGSLDKLEDAESQSCLVATEIQNDQKVVEGQIDLGTGESQKDPGTMESQNDLGTMESQNDLDTVESQNDLVTVESQNDLGAVESQNDLGTVKSQNDLGAVESQNDLGAVESQNDLGAVESQNDLGTTESQNDPGAAGSQDNLGSAESQNDLGAAGSQNNLGAEGVSHGLESTVTHGNVKMSGSPGDSEVAKSLNDAVNLDSLNNTKSQASLDNSEDNIRLETSEDVNNINSVNNQLTSEATEVLHNIDTTKLHHELELEKSHRKLQHKEITVNNTSESQSPKLQALKPVNVGALIEEPKFQEELIDEQVHKQDNTSEENHLDVENDIEEHEKIVSDNVLLIIKKLDVEFNDDLHDSQVLDSNKGEKLMMSSLEACQIDFSPTKMSETEGQSEKGINELVWDEPSSEGTEWDIKMDSCTGSEEDSNQNAIAEKHPEMVTNDIVWEELSSEAVERNTEIDNTSSGLPQQTKDSGKQAEKMDVENINNEELVCEEIKNTYPMETDTCEEKLQLTRPENIQFSFHTEPECSEQTKRTDPVINDEMEVEPLAQNNIEMSFNEDANSTFQGRILHSLDVSRGESSFRSKRSTDLNCLRSHFTQETLERIPLLELFDMVHKLTGIIKAKGDVVGQILGEKEPSSSDV